MHITSLGNIVDYDSDCKLFSILLANDKVRMIILLRLRLYKFLVKFIYNLKESRTFS